MDTMKPLSIPVRRGHHLELAADQPWWDVERAVHDACLDDALSSMTGSVAVLQSAVLLHGGLLRNMTPQAHVWVGWHRSLRKNPRGRLWDLPRPERRERLARRPVVNHEMALRDDEIDSVGSWPVTNLKRTTLDAARFLAPDDAFVAVESLLAVAAARDSWWRGRRLQIEEAADAFTADLLDRLDEVPRQRGVAQARDILSVASPFSESAWESELRRIALAAGYSDLEPQVKVQTGRGPRLVDLGHPRMRRGLEVNGDIKYGGKSGGAVRQAESERADDLAQVGFHIRPLTTAQIQDVPEILRVLDDDVGETRSGRSMPRLWTPGERQSHSAR